jgi:hypothetical protein
LSVKFCPQCGEYCQLTDFEARDKEPEKGEEKAETLKLEPGYHEMTLGEASKLMRDGIPHEVIWVMSKPGWDLERKLLVRIDKLTVI